MTAPATSLIHNDVLIRKQPPIIVSYCVPPSTGNIASACGYEATTCQGTPKQCEECWFPYCQKHFLPHRRIFQAPPDAWGGIVRRLRASMDSAAVKTRAGKQNKVTAGKIVIPKKASK